MPIEAITFSLSIHQDCQKLNRGGFTCRGILFRQQHPWDMPRGCVTVCKLFGYQLRAPRRLVLQVVNELRPSPATTAPVSTIGEKFRKRFRFTFWSLVVRDL